MHGRSWFHPRTYTHAHMREATHMDRNAPITPEQQAAWDAFEVARIAQHEGIRNHQPSAAVARVEEATWRASVGMDVPEATHYVGVVIAPVPAREVRMFTARPCRPSWREMARDIFADLKANLAHAEGTRYWM